jgi:hypothetical protein
MDGKVPVITATVSFGMGVDKASVRYRYLLGFCQFIQDPGPNFFHPGSEFFAILDAGFTSKNLSILTKKILFLRSGLFIPDPDPDFLPSRIQGSKRHRIPDPDPQHWILYCRSGSACLMILETSTGYKHSYSGQVCTGHFLPSISFECIQLYAG